MKSWVSNSLKMAENLLESVDQSAAMKLTDIPKQDNDNGSIQKISLQKQQSSNSVEQVKQKHKPIDDVHDLSMIKACADDCVFKEECSKLEVKVKELGSNVENLRHQVILRDKRSKSLEKEISDLENEFAERCAELQRQTKRLQEENQSLQEMHSAASSAKNEITRDLQQEIEELQHKCEQLEAAKESLNREIKENGQDTAWSTAAQRCQGNGAVFQGSDEELSEAKKEIEILQKKYHDVLKLAEQRRIELEKVSIDLASGLAKSQTEANIPIDSDSSKESIQRSLEGRLENSRLRESLREKELLNNQLSKKIKIKDLELNKLGEEIDSMRSLMHSNTQKYRVELEEAGEKIQEMGVLLSVLNSNKEVNSSRSVLQDQIQELSKKLVQKQELLNQASSMISALQAKLAVASRRAQSGVNMSMSSSDQNTHSPGSSRPKKLAPFISTILPIHNQSSLATTGFQANHLQKTDGHEQNLRINIPGQ